MSETRTAMAPLMDDGGFSVAELVSSLAVFAVLMVLIGQLIWVATKSNDAISTKSSYTAQVAEPMDAITKNLMQATVLENPTAYSVSFLINPSLGPDSHRVVLDMNGTDGRMSLYKTNTLTVNTGLVRSATFSPKMANKSLGRPVFKYYTLDGQEITDYSAVPSKANSVKVNLTVINDGEEMSREATVYLRNMFGY